MNELTKVWFKNECIGQKVGVALIVEKIVLSCLRWFGYVRRRLIESQGEYIRWRVVQLSETRGRLRENIGKIIRKYVKNLSIDMIYEWTLQCPFLFDSFSQAHLMGKAQLLFICYPYILVPLLAYCFPFEVYAYYLDGIFYCLLFNQAHFLTFFSSLIWNPGSSVFLMHQLGDQLICYLHFPLSKLSWTTYMMA